MCTHAHTQTHTQTLLFGDAKTSGRQFRLEQDVIQKLSNRADSDESVLVGLAAPWRHEN